ncbi:hypothetical protein SNE40_007751 [Patella caerulea]|uniref:GST N-terminal domain-containing protein n=1 Tax=Patella caerulea TaxID=87958 RepID=A0AAN8K576_PATCE
MLSKGSSQELTSDANDSNRCTLYYFPTSFSSQKVLLALFEKDVKFKPKLVSLFHGQHMEPWYVKLNPSGVHVPVFVHDKNVISNPEDIINYIDRTFDEGPCLVPSSDTELGQSVAAVRYQLNNIPVDVITYGVIFHPYLSDSGCRIPFAVQRSMRENFARRLRYLTHKATKHPDLRDGYLAKSQTAAQKYDVITDEEKVKGQLEQLETILEEIEAMMQSVQDSDSYSNPDVWLFGPHFTAADITFSCLLNRLVLLGLESRYFPSYKCPNIDRYYRQLLRRSTYRVIQKEVANMRLTLVWEDLKAVSPYMVGATGIILTGLIAYWFLKKLKN